MRYLSSTQGKLPRTPDRRSGIERRARTLSAYIYGARQPRRIAGRRSSDHYPIIDWYAPRVLALVLSILCLSAADGALTVLLMRHGATEANPLMALFLPHNLPGFAAAKWLLTGIGVAVLVTCSHMRIFRALPVEALLAGLLLAYLALIAYELEILAQLPAFIAECDAFGCESAFN